MNYIMDRLNLEKETISNAHGKEIEKRLSYGLVRIIPLYHPAVAVYNAKKFDILAKDFELLVV